MVNIILVSDGESHAWYDWLSSELVKRGHSFFLPVMPSVGESFDSWVSALKDFRKHLDESSIFIGHGAGRVVVLKVLEEKLRDVKGVFFISGSSLKNVFKDFSLDDFDFSVVKDKSKNFFVYASENDDQSSLDDSAFLAESVGDEVQLLDDAMYFKGMSDFEDLLIDVLSLVD
ncbi:alpha/beta hydrolase [Candidatus Woesearchaeota archaeon]|jgi:predicted alpha/beta hydrolase family esterase|nr:alpha/beta hydrolase [Candidatus Woesearchaeota archaeon]